MKKKSEYSQKLLDPRWQKLRLDVFQRDGFKCVICGDGNKTLHAHHSYYRRGSDGPWDYPPHSVITLCCDCHNDEHQMLEEARGRLTEIISRCGFNTAIAIHGLADDLLNFEGMSDPELGAFARKLWELSESRNKYRGVPGTIESADDSWAEEMKGR